MDRLAKSAGMRSSLSRRTRSLLLATSVPFLCAELVMSMREERALKLALSAKPDTSASRSYRQTPTMVHGPTQHLLSSGSGDGSELRSRQKASSQHWSLVTAFCQMHQIRLSTKYLAWLARDNDWVGFLFEAQIGGYTLDTVTQVVDLLADCEKQKQPGNSLLVKAKQLSWSILAIFASCLPDISPFACLTVWPEITDAR